MKNRGVNFDFFIALKQKSPSSNAEALQGFYFFGFRKVPADLRAHQNFAFAFLWTFLLLGLTQTIKK